MACCQEKQTECLKVITIGYLKSFIGNYLHSSVDNSILIVDDSKGDEYCPTYGELSSGAIIQLAYIHPTDARYDNDGIVVNSTYTGGSTATPYAPNQEVNQKDLSIRYTTLNNISISLSKTSNLDACGDNANVTTTYNYTRYSKSMNSSCSIVGPTVVETINGNCEDLSWTLTYGGISNCSSYSIDKNSSSSQRSDSIYASTIWRRATVKSNTVNVTQNGNGSGQWIETSSSASSYSLTNCQSSPSNLLIESVHEAGSKICYIPSQTLTVQAISSVTITTNYVWKDGCGDIDYDRTSATTSHESGNISNSYPLDRIEMDCCEIPTNGITVEIPVTVSFGTTSCTKVFSARCNSCSSDSACQVPPTPEECNSIYGFDTIYCEGEAQYRTGECGGEDPIIGFKTMDNMGRVTNLSKQVCEPWKSYAPPRGGWWSGPHDGDYYGCNAGACKDCGIAACGESIGDGIYFGYGKNVGTGSTVASREYHSPDFNIVSNDEWITFTVEIYTGTLSTSGDCSHGMVHYKVAKNTTGNKRIGTVTVTTTGGECDCNFKTSNDWMTEGTVYFYQRDNDNYDSQNPCPKSDNP